MCSPNMSKHSNNDWLPDAACAYTQAELDRIAQIESDVREHLSPKPRRLSHTLGVARTAEALALLYGADPYLARVAGLLHDWDKVESDSELIVRARACSLDFGGVAYEAVAPLLHGPLAARELPERYPDLPSEVWRAIEVHTCGAAQMSALDMVLFVADGIEPNRPASEGIERTRSLVGNASLEDLFWCSFVGGIVYVLQGGRYLYGGTVEVYNAWAERRAEAGARKRS